MIGERFGVYTDGLCKSPSEGMDRIRMPVCVIGIKPYILNFEERRGSEFLLMEMLAKVTYM